MAPPPPREGHPRYKQLHHPTDSPVSLVQLIQLCSAENLHRGRAAGPADPTAAASLAAAGPGVGPPSRALQVGLLVLGRLGQPAVLLRVVCEQVEHAGQARHVEALAVKRVLVHPRPRPRAAR